MKDEIRQNLENANIMLAKKMDTSMDAEELKRLAEGVATTAKAISEIDDMEERRNADFDKDVIADERATKEDKREFWKTCVSIGASVAGDVVRGLALGALIVFGVHQKSDETDKYITTPKTNNLVIDGLKSIIRK